MIFILYFGIEQKNVFKVIAEKQSLPDNIMSPKTFNKDT